ncbi:allophanate hydrolase subunit 2 family protein [Micromonospora terminaliae]|uniref:Allophanate hydrolase subunit 2 family protein n=1 Tax=Micromonospora terminaliae TaxID=1914461 RepID=A0AAJ2ZC10_9ACTN|nr:biotin-dependent carboxyltransferase family protein [Micromonospora terminaliae]NES26003.1 biotin-dependent carboxyltransferase family protein [Micromonospora terminaliae]QGL50211.1 allophanate hydrolase subunit 2 family protein [Micromonospora terminaliae]
MIEVLRAGALTTVQDQGRPGWAHLGVPRSGALDPAALRLANRLVGNPEHAAGLEITLTGCTLRFGRAVGVALTGAPVDVLVERGPFDASRGGRRPAGPRPAEAPPVERRPGDVGRPLSLPAGATLRIGPARAGVRTWLAVSGGIAVEPVLGSRATDTLSGLGPPPLRDGDRLPLGTPTGPPAPVDLTVAPAPTAVLRLALRPGPRQDWFTPAALDRLLTTAYAISPASNRVGARLAGATLPRAVAGELPSEGLVLGAVQVPPDGQPLIFLADHPTTGGYPVIGVVEDVTPLAQARPGTTVTFHGPQR